MANPKIYKWEVFSSIYTFNITANSVEESKDKLKMILEAFYGVKISDGLYVWDDEHNRGTIHSSSMLSALSPKMYYDMDIYV